MSDYGSSYEEDQPDDYEGASVFGEEHTSVSVVGDSRKKNGKITEAIIINPVIVEPDAYTDWQEVDKGLNCESVTKVLTYWNDRFSNFDRSALSILQAFPQGLIDFFKKAGNEYKVLLVTYTKLNMSNANGPQNTNMLMGLALARVLDTNGQKRVQLLPGTICKTKETPEVPNSFNPIKPIAWAAFDPTVFPMACYIDGMAKKITARETIKKDDFDPIVGFFGEDFLKTKDKKKAYTELSCNVSMGYYTSPYKLKPSTGDTGRKEVTFYTALAYNNKSMTPLIEMGYRHAQKMGFVKLDETDEMASKATESIMKITNIKSLKNPLPGRAKRTRGEIRTEANAPVEDADERQVRPSLRKVLQVRDGDSGPYQGIVGIITDKLQQQHAAMPVGEVQSDEVMKQMISSMNYTFKVHPFTEYAENLSETDFKKVKDDFSIALAMLLLEFVNHSMINCSTDLEEVLFDMPKIKDLYKTTDRGLANLAKICDFADTMTLRTVPESRTFTAICIAKAPEIMKTTVYAMVHQQWAATHQLVCKILDIQNPGARKEIKAAEVISLLFSISYMLIRKFEKKAIELERFNIPPTFKLVQVKKDFPPLPERHRLYVCTDSSIDNTIPDYMQQGGVDIIAYCQERIHRISFAAHKEMKLESMVSTGNHEFLPEYFVFFAGISFNLEGLHEINVTIQHLYLGAWFEHPVFRAELPMGAVRFNRSSMYGMARNIDRSIRRWVEDNFPAASANRNIPVSYEAQKDLKTMLCDMAADIAYNARSVMDPACDNYTGRLPDDVQQLIKGDSRFQGTASELMDEFYPKFLAFMKKLGTCETIKDELSDFTDETTRGFFFLTTIPVYSYCSDEKSILMVRIAPFLIEDKEDPNYTKQITVNPRYLHIDLEGPARTDEEAFIQLTRSEIASADAADNPSDEESDSDESQSLLY